MNQDEVARPESLDPERLMEWATNAFSHATADFELAQIRWKARKKHHQFLTELYTCLKELRARKDPNWEEEAEEIVDTWMEILDGIERLRTGNFLDPDTMPTIDDWMAEEMATPEGREAFERIQREERAFKAAYLFHKSRLGLKSQKAVAELTGIDRRYISVIERGDHKPQFKTLKTLADAFGVDVSELIGDKYLR